MTKKYSVRLGETLEPIDFTPTPHFFTSLTFIFIFYFFLGVFSFLLYLHETFNKQVRSDHHVMRTMIKLNQKKRETWPQSTPFNFKFKSI